MMRTRKPISGMVVLMCLTNMIGGCTAIPTGQESGTSQPGDGGGEPLPEPIGEPPTALASATAAGFVFPGDSVDLRGSGSDADATDDRPITTEWRQTTGTAVDLQPTEEANVVTFEVPEDVLPGETLGFAFDVRDADGNEVSDPLFLFVPRTPGVVLANAFGPEDPVPAGEEVTMRSIGSLNIPAETARYQWEIVEGPQVEVTGSDEPTGRFVAPEPGDGQIELVMVVRLTLENQGVVDTQDVEVVVAASP